MQLAEELRIPSVDRHEKEMEQWAWSSYIIYDVQRYIMITFVSHYKNLLQLVTFKQ